MRSKFLLHLVTCVWSDTTQKHLRTWIIQIIPFSPKRGKLPSSNFSIDRCFSSRTKQTLGLFILNKNTASDVNKAIRSQRTGFYFGITFIVMVVIGFNWTLCFGEVGELKWLALIEVCGSSTQQSGALFLWNEMQVQHWPCTYIFIKLFTCGIKLSKASLCTYHCWEQALPQRGAILQHAVPVQIAGGVL